MPRTKSKPTSAIEGFEAEWLQFHEKQCVKRPPPNAIDAMRYSKLVGVTDRTAFMRLKALAASGVLETGIFRTMDTNNKLRPVRYFWPKKSEPAKK